MTNTNKRDNSYWTKRLEKGGHDKLLARISADEITVYKATQLAGYRKKALKSPAAILSHHWKRASHAERKRFVAFHVTEVNRVLKEWGADRTNLKAQKPTK